MSDLQPTRDSWHRVAEHVLAAGQFATAGTIRLRAHPGGFATVVGVDGRQLAVDGDRLILEDGRSTRFTTIGELARFAGVRPGLSGSYPPATPLDPDLPLPVDLAAAERLAEWFALGDTALRRFAEGLGRTQEPVLWSEHFDLGITIDAVNYGCSPGDDAIPEPYLYVGPHEGPLAADAFWNAPFGAVLSSEQVSGTADAAAFFASGRTLVEGARPATR